MTMPKANQFWKDALVYRGDKPNAEVHRGHVLARGGRIVSVGADVVAPANCDVHDCGGRLLTPALIDCHTHIVYGGNRATEFQMRLEGASYAEIAAAGGGIVSTMRATREASVDDLVAQSLPRVDMLLAQGVGTIEIKSGYGLSIEAELNMLRAARKIAALRPVRVKTSWLAAHAPPPEYKEMRDAYITDIVLKGMERGKDEGLIDAVDGFCEHLAFTPTEIDRVFTFAGKLGLPLKLHAEQLSYQGGAALAAKHGALSADHLEWLTADDAALMAKAGTVAVLLPGAFYMLRETRLPPIAALREAGTVMAISTDCNPGTSPMTSLLMAMNMGAVLFGLTVGECVHGATGAAAKALGLQGVTGTLTPGAAADFALWNASSIAELVNPIGFNPLHARYFEGRKV